LDLGTPDEVETYDCLDWKSWGIEIGDPVDPVCR
jgi:hypothetical protein